MPMLQKEKFNYQNELIKNSFCLSKINKYCFGKTIKLQCNAQKIETSKVFKVLILLFILGAGCTKFSKKDTLLQIGPYKLSVAEYELEKAIHKELFTIQQLDSSLLNEGYFLAFALDNKYDTIDIVTKKLKYYLYDRAAKMDGFVWNKLVKPNLRINADEINDAYTKRASLYSLEILYFPTKSQLNKFIKPNVKIETGKDFYLLKKNIPSTSDIKFFQINDNYPFYPLGAYIDNILSKKKGDIIGPLEMLSGFYIVYIADVKRAGQPTYEEDKSTIEKVMLQTLTEKYLWENQRDILSKANIKYNNEAIRKIAPNFNEEKREWTGEDKGMELMKYEFLGSTYSYKINDLMEFIRYVPFISGELSDTSTIKKCMENYIQYIYLFDEAKKMQIDTDEEFVLYKKQYQEKLLLERYNEINVYPKVSVSAWEVRKYYNENQDKFRSFESATISIFKFKDRSSAIEGQKSIENQYKLNHLGNIIKAKRLAGLISFLENFKINFSDTSNNILLTNSLMTLKEGQVLFPIQIYKEFWVVYLSDKHGNCLIPFKYVEYDIENTLRKKRRQDIRDSLLATLIVKYPLKVNLLKQYNQKMENKEVKF